MSEYTILAMILIMIAHDIYVNNNHILCAGVYIYLFYFVHNPFYATLCFKDWETVVEEMDEVSAVINLKFKSER